MGRWKGVVGGSVDTWGFWWGGRIGSIYVSSLFFYLLSVYSFFSSFCVLGFILGVRDIVANKIGKFWSF